MSNAFRDQVIKLAKENPDLRKYLVPLLQKTAMEFPTEDAWEKYKKEHPGAERRDHTVKKDTGGKGTDHGYGTGIAREPDDPYDLVHLDSVAPQKRKYWGDFNRAVKKMKGKGLTHDDILGVFEPVLEDWVGSKEMKSMHKNEKLHWLLKELGSLGDLVDQVVQIREEQAD